MTLTFVFDMTCHSGLVIYYAKLLCAFFLISDTRITVCTIKQCKKLNPICDHKLDFKDSKLHHGKSSHPGEQFCRVYILNLLTYSFIAARPQRICKPE